MRKLITAALVLAATLGVPTIASAHDRDGWYDGGRREWRDDRYYDRRDDRWDRRRWGNHRNSRHHWRQAGRRDVVCRTEWHYGHRERICYRRY